MLASRNHARPISSGSLQASISCLVKADTALGPQIPLDEDFTSKFGLPTLGLIPALEARVDGRSILRHDSDQAEGYDLSPR